MQYLQDMRVLSLAVIFAVALSCSTSRPFKNEPDGFRGIKWGTPLTATKDMKFVADLPSGEKFYQRENDLMELGLVKLKLLGYFFRDGSFQGVQIHYSCEDTQLMKQLLVGRYGEPTNSDSTGWARWIGPVGAITLCSPTPSEPSCILLITSAGYDKQIKAEIENKKTQGF